MFTHGCGTADPGQQPAVPSHALRGRRSAIEAECETRQSTRPAHETARCQTSCLARSAPRRAAPVDDVIGKVMVKHERRCGRVDKGPSDPSSNGSLVSGVRRLVLSNCDVALVRRTHRARGSTAVDLPRKHCNRSDLDAAHIGRDLSCHADVDGIFNRDVSDHDVHETVLLLSTRRGGGSEQHARGTQ
jgi:hypothetical protein